MKLLIHIILSILFTNMTAYVANAQDVSSSPASSSSTQDPCAEVQLKDKSVLRGGWFLWEPYQFNHMTPGGFELTGMDVQLEKAIAEQLGMAVHYEPVAWKQHQLDLKNGDRDIASGATYTDARAEYVYFSVPYRFEANSLFTLRDSSKNLNFTNIKEFLAQVRLQNYKLGVIDGFIYAAPDINAFLKDEANGDIVVKVEDDLHSIQALMRGEIDGFLSDRVVGSAVILSTKLGSSVKEVPLNIKTPIHFMFSKKAVPLELVEKFNNTISTFVASDKYKAIIQNYLYPVLLLQTINADWFYIVGMIGTVAFALSGVAIAAKENATLFGTFIFAMLPSVGGGVLRDVIINRGEVGLTLTPSYMYCVVIVVLVGFAGIRLLDHYNKNAEEDGSIGKFWNNLITVGDAAGQAAFIVTGVAIAITAHVNPIVLWCPFFAFLTANGGGIVRDVVRKGGVVECLSGEINAEVSVVWGLIFSVFLSTQSYNPDPDKIKYAVIFVVCGGFITRMVVHYFKVPNLRFRQ